MEHKYAYRWKLAETTFTKNKFTVFSCFSCSGGSTMGYKLAGGDVLGCLEIDPKLIATYKLNHNPKYAYCEDIRLFNNRTDIPAELYNLDILDGSPPCSSFSMAGNREKDWGKEKIFAEGQALQVLDTLFFDFIALANKLQPKIVVAENVKGLLMGNAIKYVERIYKEFDEAGYYCQHFLLNAATMGVPQRRERAFFICMRKDLAEPYLEYKNLELTPKIDMEFDEPIVPFGEISDDTDDSSNLLPCLRPYWEFVENGKSFSDSGMTDGKYFSYKKMHPDRPINTLTTNKDSYCHHLFPRRLNGKEIILASSFPTDFDFGKVGVNYACGMSVPPVMMANIADRIYNTWLRND